MTRLIAISLAVLFLFAGGGYLLVTQSSGPALPTLGMAEAQQDNAEVDTSMIEQYVLGDADAPVTMIEYASFTCPHCKNFHLGPLIEIKKNYIDTGKVKLEYREVYFDRFGLWAALVARCGGELRYFGLVDLLYRQQAEWLDGADAAAIAENLRKLGRSAGIGNDELDACLSDGDKALALVALFQANAEADKVEATPSFVIGGTTYRNMSYGEMAELLDAELAK